MNKESYALGLSIASQLKSGGISVVSTQDFSQAIEDVMNNRELKIGYEEARTIVANLINKAASEEKEQNQTKGKAYLDELRKHPDFTELESGLLYEVIRMGDGKKPQITDTVTVHYEGRLIDGTVFDSSKQRGEPASFPVTAVIKGWTEILQLMPVGSHWRVAIPSELAYGERGAGDLIRPNSTLVFDIELLKIEDKQ